jgi:hypothetical protein
MHSRIEFVSNEAVHIQRNGNLVTMKTGLRAFGGELHMGDLQDVRHCSWDRDGLNALDECVACYNATGSFAALKDTSAELFRGKRVRTGMGGAPVTFLHFDRNGKAVILFSDKSMGTWDREKLKPLVDPPVIKPYTSPEQAVWLIGKKIVGTLVSATVLYVGADCVRLKFDHTAGPVDTMFKDLATATCEGKPCGIVEKI